MSTNVVKIREVEEIETEVTALGQAFEPFEDEEEEEFMYTNKVKSIRKKRKLDLNTQLPMNHTSNSDYPESLAESEDGGKNDSGTSLNDSNLVGVEDISLNTEFAESEDDADYDMI